MKITIAKSTLKAIGTDTASIVKAAFDALGGAGSKGVEFLESLKQDPGTVNNRVNYSVDYDAVTDEYCVWLNDDLIIRQVKQQNLIIAAYFKAIALFIQLVTPLMDGFAKIAEDWVEKKEDTRCSATHNFTDSNSGDTLGDHKHQSPKQQDVVVSFMYGLEKPIVCSNQRR